MSSQKTVLAVIVSLATLAVLVVAGGIYLTANDKSLPGELIAIGSAAAGAIAGLLSKTGTEPQDVNVVNNAAEAVPVDPTPGPAKDEDAELGSKSETAIRKTPARKATATKVAAKK